MKQPPAPASMDEFTSRLMTVSASLPKRLRQCADFVAANTDRIAVSTIAELSRAARVQPSAFMRFCKLLGFSGFSEMQRLFRDTYSQRWPNYATRLENLKARGADSAPALLAEFVEAGHLSLENLANTVDLQVLETVVDILAKTSMIHVIGLRRAMPVASYLAYTFEKMDIPAMLHAALGKLDHRHAIRPGDALVAITFTPFSQETIDLAGYAHSQGNQIIAITDAGEGPLTEIGAKILRVSEVDVGAFRALSATLSLATSLAVAVGSARRNKSE